MVLVAGRASLEVRLHAWDRAVGVGPREPELDVAVELLEALLAAQLRSGRTGKAREQTLGISGVNELISRLRTGNPNDVGAVTGVVAPSGGLGGFFPPLLMALVKSITGGYALGFIQMAAVAAICLVVLPRVDRDTVKPAHKLGLRSSGTAMTPRVARTTSPRGRIKRRSVAAQAIARCGNL